MGEFLKEGGTGEQLLVDIRDAAGSLKRTAARLEADDNLVGKMLNDPEYSEQLADDLQGLLANLNDITGKINRGEGTLGALVNDRAVYDGMEEIVAGVNDSGFARWLMRRYQKKGIKVQDDVEEGAGGTDGQAEPAGP